MEELRHLRTGSQEVQRILKVCKKQTFLALGGMQPELRTIWPYSYKIKKEVRHFSVVTPVNR